MSETDYINQIQQLVQLQKIDDEIFAVKKEINDAPKLLEDMKRDFDALSQRRDHLLDKKAHIEEQKKRLSHEGDENAAKLKKSRDKMMQVGNEREHQAIVREMDSLERSSRAREEEQVIMSDELSRTSEALEELEKDYNALKDELQTRTDSLEETLSLAKDRLAVLGKQRENASGSIPRPIFQRYEFIRERLKHPVIVPVDDGICSGCHIAIPPQSFIECQRGQQILSCPNCQRLVFWSNHFADPSLPQPVKRSKKIMEDDLEDEGDEDMQEVVEPLDNEDYEEDEEL